jgi:hypothetical protein
MMGCEKALNSVPFGIRRRTAPGFRAYHGPAQSFATVRIDTVALLSDGAALHSAESDAVGAVLPAIRSRGRIEIDVAGARIRIESGVDHATLAMVLAAVRGDK